MNILVFNTGSSSLKFGLFESDSDRAVLRGEIDWADGNRAQATLTLHDGLEPAERATVAVPDDSRAAVCTIRAVTTFLSAQVDSSSAIEGIGHRIVHGGSDFSESVRIDRRVKQAIHDWGTLAPLHNPAALKTIEAAEAAFPQIPQVAVFDTAFFGQLTPQAFLYPLPYEYYTSYGIRRFGFHGISHAYCAQRATALLGPKPRPLRFVSCHLGGGCSAAAIRDGVAVATTLGFSASEGLMMGTRSGSIDPGIILYLARERGISINEIERVLNGASGLLGISGISPDLAQIERAAAQGNERARLAFDMFVDRVRSAIGALAATLGGIDALIFTDRIGERSPALRAAVCQGLEFMGLHLDPQRNLQLPPDADIAHDQSSARILTIHCQEEWMVAQDVQRLLRGVN